MVKLSRQKRKVTNKRKGTNKRKKRQSKKTVLRGGSAAGPLAAHECPFTPEIIINEGYTIGFIEEDVFERNSGELRHVEIRGGDHGGHMGDTPDKKHLVVYNLRPEPLKATELLFVKRSIPEMDGWSVPQYTHRGGPPLTLNKKTGDGFNQQMERLDINEPLPLPGAIAKWTGGSGITAYIVCKSKIQHDLDICRRIAECLMLPYSPPGYDNYITRYQNFSTDGLLNVKEGEKIYS